MPKRANSATTLAPTEKKQKQLSSIQLERLDPTLRNIHPDAIQANLAPSSRATCVDCGKTIPQGAPRWGIKYGGNPLALPVIPLYGSHPMVMYCHAGGCGLSYVRVSEQSHLCEAAKTCHYCSNAPDEALVKLLCGGRPNQQHKIRQHAFHIRCWKDAIEKSPLNDEDKKQILIDYKEIKKQKGVSWEDLTLAEQAYVADCFGDRRGEVRRRETSEK
ncbi:hypothetical protein MPSEU_000702300 [Mayamaea pseudoterrestris]|nr:hypothetical protein MPSEU_000702300 [Mayamaea pseudoterrestris]